MNYASRPLTISLLSDFKHSSRKLSPNESSFISASPFKKCSEILGRESQIQILDDTFQRVEECHESEAVMVHGPSGIGKSALVNFFLHSLPPKVLVARGKFDQGQCRAPYSALVTMSDNLCRQILRQENSTEIREKVRAILGSELSLLGTLVPKLAQMDECHSQFAHSERAQSTSSSNRFKQVFRTFLRSVASEENPVVFFLDDIQWADVSSLEILESLINDPLSQNILIVCAYRDDDSSSEIFQRFCDSMSQNLTMDNSPHQVTTIQVDKLQIHDLSKMLSARLHLNLNEVQSLGSLIWNKTNGNPLYASHFLDMLYSSGMLSRKLDGNWTWDESKILLQTNVADNLLQVLEYSLQRIPNQVRSILQIASFIGYEFSDDLLTTTLCQEQDMIESEYSFNRLSKEIIHEQITIALKLACNEGLLETDIERDSNYKFAHDKIRQVLYEDLMPDLVERQLLHQRIGVLIYEALKDGQAPNDLSVFLAANNLNCALNPCISHSDITYEIVNINLLAGKAALKKSDFSLASDYLETAVSLIANNNFWESNYNLCIDVHTLKAEVEMVNANYACADSIVNEISIRAKSWVDQCSAFQVRIKCLAGQGKLKEAVSLGCDILRKLDVKFPKNITAMSLAKEFLLAKFDIGRRRLSDLIDLPELSDQRLICILSLMDGIACHAFILGDSFKDTFAFFSVRIFRLTLKHGCSALYAPIAFISWGIFHAAMGAFDEAFEARQIAFKIIDRFNSEAIRGRASMIAWALIDFWRMKLDTNFCTNILSMYHHAMAYGDVFYAQLGVIGWVAGRTYLDIPLLDMHSRMKAILCNLRAENAMPALTLILPNWQFILNICGDNYNTDPSCLRGEALDESFVAEMQHVDSQAALFRLKQWEMMVAYIFGNWGLLANALSCMKKYEKKIVAVYPSDFSDVWVAICSYDLFLETGKKYYRKQGQQAHRKVSKYANSGSPIFIAPSMLLSAMASLCNGKNLEQIKMEFQAAIAALSDAKCSIFEAIGNERLAKCLLSLGLKQHQARDYQKRATEIYRKWGAVKKAELLDE